MIPLGVDRVVVILGVGGIDGHQRQIAPILAIGHVRGPRRFGLGEGGGGEDMGDVVGMSAIRLTARSVAAHHPRRG